jgi:outer membrane immunogenic protein
MLIPKRGGGLIENVGFVMRTFLSAVTIVAFATTTSVFAADLAVKAPAMNPAAPVQFSWTGCYIGGHLGGVVSQDTTTGVLGNSNSFSSTGFVGGGQIGCDYQFAPGWVAGIEGRAAWTSLKNSHAGVVRNLALGTAIPSQFTLSNDFLASATARLGYSVADRWLVFVRGGGAWTHEKIDIAFTNLAGIPVDPSETTTRTGWTVGTGVDWAFAPNWSAHLEYNYYDFGSRTATVTSPTNIVTVPSLKDRIHAVTTGVNYHF